jgi:hypothetical protein
MDIPVQVSGALFFLLSCFLSSLKLWFLSFQLSSTIISSDLHFLHNYLETPLEENEGKCGVFLIYFPSFMGQSP